jgi:hypothetical protein
MPSGILIPVTVTIEGVKKTFASLTDLALHVGSNRSAPITWRSRNPDRPIQDWVDKQLMRKVARATITGDPSPGDLPTHKVGVRSASFVSLIRDKDRGSTRGFLI